MRMRSMAPITGSKFITITLLPKIYKYTANEQFSRMRSVLINVLNVACKEWVLHAELTEQANVHYHGWYTEAFPGATLQLLDCFKGYTGFIQVNKQPITDIKRTYEYMRKSDEVTRKFIKHPVMSNFFDGIIPSQPPNSPISLYNRIKLDF